MYCVNSLHLCNRDALNYHSTWSELRYKKLFQLYGQILSVICQNIVVVQSII